MPDKLRCEGCGGSFTRLGKHLTSSPRCFAAAFGSAAKEAKEPPASAASSVPDNAVSLVLYSSQHAVAVVDDLSSLRYDHYMSEANIERVKVFASRWQSSNNAFIQEQLAT